MTTSADRRARAAAQPVLRQVPRHRDRRRRRHACGSRPRCRRCWPIRPPAGAGPACPTPATAVGFAFLPEVGAGVWIEFEGGDVSYPIWVGCYWRDGEVPSRRRRRRCKAIVTKAGHADPARRRRGAAITITDPTATRSRSTLERHHAAARRPAASRSATPR